MKMATMQRMSRLLCAGLLLAVAVPAIVLLNTSLSAQRGAGTADSPTMTPAASVSPYIDNHVHPDGADIPGSIEAAVRAMNRENAVQIVFEPPPFLADNPGKFDAELLLSAAKKYQDKIAVYGGGGTLNVMIQDAVVSGKYDERAFRNTAEQLVRSGVAGFGEISLEHFSQPNVSDYQYSPADHPLMLALADVAARAGVPIVVHMEAVPAPMKLPAGLQIPPHPPQLHDNVAAFERLLSHNPQAKIIWTHLGADYTGFRTADLCRRLLQGHPNLYMEIKVDPLKPGFNALLSESGNGTLRPEWLRLFSDFPDRFVIGSDQHYGPKDELFTGRPRWAAAVGLLNQLPAAVRNRIALENARRLRP
jgi:predicted TIM-barrel fold metal-dependent hydrolase